MSTKNTQVGIPSPNPSFPSLVEVVKGDNEVKIENKNRFNILNVKYQSGNTPTINGTKIQANSPTAWSSIYYTITNLKKNTTYYIKSNLAYTSGGGCYSQIFGGEAIDQSKLIKTYIKSSTTSGDDNSSFNTGSYDTITISFCTSGNSGVWELSNIIISDEDISYVPHAEQVYPITLPEGLELAKIGDYQDKLFKAISGDVVYDSLTSTQKEGLTSGSWYKLGEIGKYIFKASDNWYGPIYYHSNQNIRWSKDPSLIGINIKANTPIYCNSLIYSTDAEASSSGKDNLIVYSAGWYISITYGGTTDRATMNNFFESIGMYLYYVLATPTFTEITDTTLIQQLENWRNSKSYQGQTNISQTNDDKAFVISYTTLKDVYAELDSRLKALEG